MTSCFYGCKLSSSCPVFLTKRHRNKKKKRILCNLCVIKNQLPVDQDDFLKFLLIFRWCDWWETYFVEWGESVQGVWGDDVNLYFKTLCCSWRLRRSSLHLLRGLWSFFRTLKHQNPTCIVFAKYLFLQHIYSFSYLSFVYRSSLSHDVASTQ